jgi:hypothetical protein
MSGSKRGRRRRRRRQPRRTEMWSHAAIRGAAPSSALSRQASEQYATLQPGWHLPAIHRDGLISGIAGRRSGCSTATCGCHRISGSCERDDGKCRASMCQHRFFAPGGGAWARRQHIAADGVAVCGAWAPRVQRRLVSKPTSKSLTPSSTLRRHIPSVRLSEFASDIGTGHRVLQPVQALPQVASGMGHRGLGFKPTRAEGCSGLYGLIGPPAGGVHGVAFHDRGGRRAPV